MVYPIGPALTYVDDNAAVQFEYLIGGHSQIFVVSRQALEDHFRLDLRGAAADNRDDLILESFQHGWERIRNAAARSRSVPCSGRIVLNSSDF